MDAEFRRLNDAQFERANRALDQVSFHFIYMMAEEFTRRTPGFEGPGFAGQGEGTNYIPTGRLRGGLNWTRSPIKQSSKGYAAARHEDGPFSAYGRETLDRISNQLKGQHLGGMSYLENNVAYGILIVEAREAHARFGPRDWPTATRRSQDSIARRAIAAVKV